MRKFDERTVLPWVFVLVAAAMLILATLTTAGAHSWYEPQCCSSTDCAPVDDGVVEEKSDGIHVKGYGVLSYTDPRIRWSKDDQDHLCTEQYGQHKLLCVYRKPKGY